MERQEWSALLVDGGLDAAARHAHDEVLLQRHRDHLIEALQPCTAHSRHSRHSRSSSARRLEKCAGVRECSAGRAVARGGWSRVEGSPEPAPPRPRGPRGPRSHPPRAPPTAIFASTSERRRKCCRTFPGDGGAFDVHDHLLLRDHGGGCLGHDDSLKVEDRSVERSTVFVGLDWPGATEAERSASPAAARHAAHAGGESAKSRSFWQKDAPTSAM